MVSLARASIIIDWRRYITIISMLTLTGLILTVEAAIFAGMMSNSTHSILESRADLMDYEKQQQLNRK